MPSYRLVMAAIILAIYFIFAGVLLYNLYHAGSAAPDWSQVLAVFNAIGALATTAAGVLFGVEIQQGNVDSSLREAQEQAKIAGERKGIIASAFEQLEPSAQGAVGADVQAGQARRTLLRGLADA